MTPSTWRGRPRRRARGKGAGGAAKRSPRAASSPVRVPCGRWSWTTRQGRREGTCFGYIWCGAPVTANHLADAHGLDRLTADWSFIGFPTSLLSVRRSHTDLNPAC
jgi:hypothetical protein